MSSYQQYQLRTLVTARKVHLARKLRRSAPPPEVQRNTAGDALKKLVQKEISSSMSTLFATPSRQGANIPGSSYAEAGSSRFPAGKEFDLRQMETAMDQMVASSLTNGRHTSTVLRSLFGLVPSLIGR